MTTWFQDWGNIRQMHSDKLAPAGVAVEFEERPAGFWVRAKIVEPGAVKLVREKVYKAFSIGLNAVRIIRDRIAKNGRVIDGFQSELSLVDFPANPESKFEIANKFVIAKRAAVASAIETVEKHIRVQLAKAHTGEPAEVTFTPSDLVEKLQRMGRITGVRVAKRDVAKLPQKWKKGTSTTKTTDPDKAAVDADVTKGAKDCTKCGKGYNADSPSKYCGDCGTKLGAAKTEAADTTKAGSSADAKPGLADHPEPDGDEAGPDVDGDGDGAKPTAGTVQKAAYHLRRVHDAICPAYHDDDVLAVHPALAKGVPGVVDPAVFAAEMTRALEADAGTGSQLAALSELSTAYGLAVQLAGADPELLELAVGDVRKAFANYYPDARPTPTDMVPGKFQRGYLTAGHAPLSAKDGQKPRVPMASKVPSAADFQKPLITAGHEAEAPASIAKGRSYYTAAARDQATKALTAMHDYIASQNPGVCALAAPAGDIEPAVANASGSTLTTATPPTSAIDLQAAAVPTPVTADQANAATLGAVTKAAGVDTPAEAPGLDDLASLLHSVIAEHVTPLSEEVSALGKRLHELESAPDPAQAAVRGVATLAALKATQETPAGRDDGEAVESLVRLVKRARHADSTVSVPAYEQLLKTLGPARAAELLG